MIAVALMGIARESPMAQQVAPAGITPPGAAAAASDSAARYRFFKRAGVGVVGWFAGVAAGAFIASTLPRHDCHCDDPGLNEALAGIAIGGVGGGAVGAAIPNAGATCGYGARFGRGLLGSAVGMLLGGVITLPTFAPAAIVALPLGSASGAALAIGDC